MGRDRFAGQVVLVTGGGSGIGRAMVDAFHGEAAHVLVVDVAGERAEEVVAALGGGPRLEALQADVSDREAVDRLRDDVLQRVGKVDVLCNNAGIFDDFKTALETDDELWERVMRVDVTGPFLMSRAFIPSMIERGGGRIVMTASVASHIGGAGGVAYTVAKHAILGLTRQLAFDHGGDGVRVNAVCPGAIATNLSTTTRRDGDGANPRIQQIVDESPAGRWGRPEDVARLTMFLAGDEADFMHGASVAVDGGWTIT